MTQLLDPTAETSPSTRTLAPRLAELSGVRVALLDISKPRGSLLMDHFEQRLTDLGAVPVRFVKPTFAKPAPPDLREEITRQCGAVIEALAD